MRTPDLRAAVDTLASLLEEKRQNEKKERKAIDTVNRAFRHIGYQLTKSAVKGGGETERPATLQYSKRKTA